MTIMAEINKFLKAAKFVSKNDSDLVKNCSRFLQSLQF